MKKIFTTAVGLCLAMAANSFAITKADTTILGQNYAKATTCTDFDQVRTWTNNGEVVNVFVMNDIDCGNNSFTPIGQSEEKAFEGIFEGNGMTISGLNIDRVSGSDESYAGFFALKCSPCFSFRQPILNIFH